MLINDRSENRLRLGGDGQDAEREKAVSKH
jgi:hypothetical protein